MDTLDLSKLKRDILQENLYDLFVQNFNLYSGYLNYIIVSRQYEMRLDYLCSDLYGDIQYIGYLMKLNDIFNPFSIKEGDIIVYVPSNKLTSSLYQDPKVLQAQAKELIKAIKTSNIDPNRSNYLDKLKVAPKLPPIVDITGSPKNEIDDTSIKIAPTLYTTPGNIVNTDTNGLGNVFDTNTNAYNNFNIISNNNGTERILVNTFIRSNNVVITTDKTNTNDNAS